MRTKGMNVSKKLVCAFLALLITAGTLSSCSSKADQMDPQTAGTSAADTARPDGNVQTISRVEDNLPADLDFKGENVVFLTSDKVKMELFTSDLKSEPINDSIYNRKIFVEDRLNVKISFPKYEASFLEEAQKQLSSGDQTYDVYGHVSHQMADYVFRGYYLNLADMDYLDFDMPWWNKDFIQECSVKDRVFMITGSLSLSLLRGIFAVYFNKTLAEEFKSTYPELGNLYGLVDSGKWTVDKFTELGSDIYIDNNGNQEHDPEDTYGILMTNYVMDMPWGAFDISVFEKDEDDWFVFNVNTDKLFTAYEKLFNLYYGIRGSAVSGFDTEHVMQSDEAGTLFSNGTVLFMINNLSAVERKTLRNMTDDYGILPEPKYNEQQKEYYALPEEFSCFSIPITNDHPDAAAAVLEAMASYSYNETRPYYLDLALKGKYMSDPPSRRMIDLTVGNVKIDAALTYLEEIAAGYTQAFRSLLWARENNFASTHEQKKRKVAMALIAYKATVSKLFGD